MMVIIKMMSQRQKLLERYNKRPNGNKFEIEAQQTLQVMDGGNAKINRNKKSVSVFNGDVTQK
jgi:hypothetical protein